MAESPYFEVFTIETNFTDLLDSACWTFFQKDNATALLFRSLVYTNGSNDVEFYVAGDVQYAPGTIRLQGLTTPSGCSVLVTQQCCLGQPCPGVYVFYRCDIFKGKDNPDVTKEQTRYAISSFNCCDTPAYCYNASIAVAETQNFGGNNNFYRYPRKLPMRCVTRFNGASCINAQLVPPSFTTALPAPGCNL